MSEILIESMTRYCYRPSPAHFFWIRMWRQEKTYGDILTEYTRNEAIGTLVHLENKIANKYVIASVLLAMDRMNAVEVVDEKGDGVVLYKDWP